VPDIGQDQANRVLNPPIETRVVALPVFGGSSSPACHNRVNRPVFTGAQDDVAARRGHDRVVKVSKHVATGPV